MEQAAQAEAGALAALDKAKIAQTHSTEAWLTAKSGIVQNRRPGASRWQKTELQQRLAGTGKDPHPGGLTLPDYIQRSK